MVMAAVLMMAMMVGGCGDGCGVGGADGWWFW